MFQDGVKKTILTKRISVNTELYQSLGNALMSTNIAPGPCKIAAPLPIDRRSTIQNNTGFLRFPSSNFRYSLTLFSKFFASFPHGTCSLSVSRQYLALEGIYLLLWAAVPSNSTRWKNTVRVSTLSHKRDSHPLWYPIPRDFDQGNTLVKLL